MNKKNPEMNSDDLEGSALQFGDHVLYLNGGVDSDTIAPIIGAITVANMAQKQEPIILFINSCGGDLHEGFALASVIEASQVPIITVAIGECDSSALMVAMSGHWRLVAENCSILSHQYSAGFGVAKHADILARQKDLILTADKVIDHYFNHSSLTREEIADKLVKDCDVFLSADEAIQYGLFDELFLSFGQLTELYSETEELLQESQPSQ